MPDGEQKVAGRNGSSRAYKLCPQCENFSHLSEGHIFCVVCGTKLIEGCPSCSAPIRSPMARFCTACGTKIISSTPPGGGWP